MGSDATNNLNQLVPGETAKFLMDNPALDPSWQAHVQNIIAFIETNFGDTLEFGARPIKEQYAFHYKMGSHTARYAAVNARYAELTGDAAAKDKAFRAFNWATYMVRNSGLTIDGPYPNRAASRSSREAASQGSDATSSSQASLSSGWTATA